MKGFIRRRIFSVMGIVLGAVLGFVGVVVGVMAAMGKFKTPTVYPTVLAFETTEQTIIEGITFDTDLIDDWAVQFQDKDKAPKIESFKLVGTNPDYEEEVNKRNCYIWFGDGEGSKLITLCEKNGKPLVPDGNNRYLVKCNEPIYYVVNKLDDNETTNGKVTIYARSTNDILKKPDAPLTIYIDRVVNSVFVDRSMSDINTNNLTQNIYVGVDIGFDFKYVVDTPLSLKPITDESAKEIELYYVATGYQEDYLKVTKEEIENPNSPLNSILTYEEGVFKFNASVAGSHVFKIGVFPTYKAKADYLASIEGQTIVNPNYHRTNNMTLTTLNVAVENIEITEVGFTGNVVALNLYSENDYVTLNGVSGVSGAKDNNLKLQMLKSDGLDEVMDYSRYDETTMGGFTNNVWSTRIPTFTASINQVDDDWIYNDEMEYTYPIEDDEDDPVTVNMKYVLSDLWLSDTLQVVSHLYREGDADNHYFCSNGVAVFNHNTSGEIHEKIILLKPGVYLNFFVERVENEKATYSIANFDYVSTVTGSGQTKSWNIRANEIPELVNDPANNIVENLKIGVLVVNSTGKFEVENYFKTLGVSIDVIPFEHEVLKSEITLDVEFAESNEYQPSKELFENLINIKGGSYSSSVLMVEEKSSDGEVDNFIDTIPSIKFIDETTGTTYLLVGYYETEPLTNKKTFVNAVRVNEKLSSANKECNLILVQLKNAYEQTTDDIIASLTGKVNELVQAGDENAYVLIGFEDTVEIANIYENIVNVKGQYVLNEDLMQVKFYDVFNEADVDDKETNFDETKQVYKVYEHESNTRKIVVSSTHNKMIETLSSFYGEVAVDINSVNDNLRCTEKQVVENPNGTLDQVVIITYIAKSYEKNPISISLIEWGGEKHLGDVLIESVNPTQIVLSDGQGNVINLSNNDKVLESNSYLEIEVEYNSGYSYKSKLIINGNSFAIKNLDGNDATIAEIFNSSISVPNGEIISLGFQDETYKGQNLGVSYDCVTKSIFNTDNLSTGNIIAQTGDCVLKVTVGETTQYLKIRTVANSFELKTRGEATSFTQKGTSFALNSEDSSGEELISLTYNDVTPGITMSYDNLVFVKNLTSVTYGNGILDPVPESENKLLLVKKGENGSADETILTAESNGGVWTFTRTNENIELTIRFDVQTIAGTKTLVVSFEESVVFGINNVWKNNTVFYAGTSIVLDDGVSDGTGNSVLYHKFADGVAGTLKYSINNEATKYEVGSSISLTDAHIGTLRITIYLDNEELFPLTDFTVKPNVIVKSSLAELESDTQDDDYEIKEIYTLSSYENKTYGNAENPTYEDEDLTGTSSDLLSNLSISVENHNNTDPVLTGGTSLDIGPMSNVNDTPTRKINLTYTYPSGTFKITGEEGTLIKIVNRHQPTIDYTVSEQYNAANPTSPLVFKALKPYNSFAIIAGYTLQTISADDVTFRVDNTGENVKFLVETSVDVTKVNLNVLLTYTNGTNTLYYDTVVTIEPYKPDVKSSINTAFSDVNYDLLNEIYDVANFDATKIHKLKVVEILDENNTVITNEIAPTFNRNNGYNSDVATGHASNINFNISGEQKTVKVQFEITYAGESNKTHTYEVELDVYNRQTIEVSYPENLTANFEMTFLEGFEKDAEILGGTLKTNGNYQLNEIKFEPLMVYANNSTVLNFAKDCDDVKLKNRLNVQNDSRLSAEQLLGLNTSTDVAITLVAYQPSQNVSTYAQNNIECKTNQIIFKKTENEICGMLIFKLTTVSNNFEYYAVYINRDVNGADTIKAENNLDVVLYKGTLSPIYSTVDAVKIETTEDSISYVDLMSEISSTTFKNTFGLETFNSNATGVYLYNINVTGIETTDDDYELFYDTDADGASDQWTKLNIADASKGILADVINISTKFQTIKIGLVYNYGPSIFMYGTVTIYVQPSAVLLTTSADGSENYTDQFIIDEKIGTTFAYSLANGCFTADVKASATEIESPFGENYVAKIISVDGDTTISEYENIVSNSDNNSSVELGDRVGENTTILVKYSFNNTIVFVEYKFLKTVVPTETNEEIQIGELKTRNNDGTTEYYFDNIVNLTTKDHYDFMGTYSGEFNVYLGQGNAKPLLVNNVENGNVTLNGTTLTFKQTTEIQPIDITIEYSNMNSLTQRVFKFIVRKGIDVDRSFVGDNSGLENNKPVATTPIGTYNTTIGSTLNVTYQDKGGYYEFKIGELVIRTVDASFFEFMFNKQDYVVKVGQSLTERKNIKISSEDVDADGKTKLNFVHTIDEQLITATIKIYRNNTDDFTLENFNVGDSVYGYYDSNKAPITDEDATAVDGASYYSKGVIYDTITFYIKVTPTYGGLKATYATEGATHENVVQGSTVDLHETLFGSLTRYALLDVNGEVIETIDEFGDLIVDGEGNVIVDLSKMGFTIDGNPNQLKFSVIENASMTDGKMITFANSLKQNTLCYLYLANEAGLTADTNNTYAYQIMASDVADGIDYEKTNGHYDVIDKTEPESDIEYLSFMLEDTDKNEEYFNSTSPFVIGRMLDSRNGSVFTLDEFKFDGTQIAAANIRQMTNFVGAYTNAIQYQITANEYTFYLTLNRDKLDENNKAMGVVELIVQRRAQTDADYEIENHILTISLGGVNGKTTIASGLEIYLSKDKVISQFEDSYDTATIYAEETIHLFKSNDEDGLFDDGKFIENSGKASELDYELETSKSSYTIGGSVVNGSINDLISYNPATKTISSYPIGKIAQVTLAFTVKSGNYILKSLTYKFTLQVNYQFVVNGESVEGDIEGIDLHTNFVMPTNNFPTTINFTRNSEVKVDGENKNVTMRTIDGVDTYYYDVLAFDSYKLKTAQGNNKVWGSASVKIKPSGAYFPTDIITVTDTGLTFEQDFSGTITLLLVLETDNGNYEAYWTISVTPVVATKYLSDNPNNAKYQDGVDPYSSNDTVVLMSQSSDSNSPVMYTIQDYFETRAINPENVTVNYRYAISKINSTTSSLTNMNLFEDNAYILSKSEWKNDKKLKNNSFNLPYVPTSVSDKAVSYYVTYKFYITYLGLVEEEVDVFYATFIVNNVQNITMNNADVKVNRIYNPTSTSNYFLDLMYYSETFTDETNETKTYVLTYSDNNILLTVDSTTYKYDSTKNGFVDGEENIAYSYNTTNNTLVGAEGNEIVATRTQATSNPDEAHPSVFNAGFNNIFEFKAFVDLYLNKESVKLNAEKLNEDKSTFTFVEIEKTGVEIEKTGRYGVNLFENGKLFDNELRAKLSFVLDDVETLSIEPYSATYTTGFRLIAKNNISAKTNLGEGYALSKYFLEEYFTSKDSKVSLETPVIGVGAPENSWVNNADTTQTPSITQAASGNKVFATISIPSKEGDNVYNICEVTYYGTGGNDLYSVQQSYFYIDLNGNNLLVIPDYSVGIASNYFKVTYKVNSEGKVTLDLSTSTKVLTMNDGGELILADKDSGLTINSVTLSDSSASVSGSVISIASNVLSAYKLANPSKKNYDDIYATITTEYGDDEQAIYCKVQFSLPQTVEHNVAFTGDETTDFNLVECGQLKKVECVEDDEYLNLTSGKLTLKLDKVKTYFASNTTQSTLTLHCVANYTDGTTQEFTIVVNKTN